MTESAEQDQVSRQKCPLHLYNESGLEHNHHEETKQIVRQVIRSTTKRKAIEDTSVRPSKIVISENENCPSVNTDLILLKDIN
ncbi:hypothetical protein QTP88_014059 [Uroleucon formosanum]